MAPRPSGASPDSDLPPPAFIESDGFATNDTTRLNTLLARHVGVPLDIDAFEADIAIVAGLDRYETVTWRMTRDAARGYGLRVHGRAKAYAPPFLMLGMNLENTTSSDFRITATARYLAFDVLGSGSELRIDGTIGSDPHLAAELYRPLGPTPLFVAPYAGVGSDDVQSDRQRRGDCAVPSNRLPCRAERRSEPRGAERSAAGRLCRAHDRVDRWWGTRDFRSCGARRAGARWCGVWTRRTVRLCQAAGCCPRCGCRACSTAPTSRCRARASISKRRRPSCRRWRIGSGASVHAIACSSTAAFGTSFDDVPLPTDQFALGAAFQARRVRYGRVARAGLLLRRDRLATCGKLAGCRTSWADRSSREAGSKTATPSTNGHWPGWRTNGAVGLVMDTLVGPVMVAGSWGFDGRWRTYLGVGRTFR